MKKLRWAVPRWSYAPRLWRDLRRILNLQSLARVVFVSAVVCIAIVLVCKLAVPNLALRNLWPMLLALPGILLAVVAQMALLTLIPPFVTIRSDRVQYLHGEHGFQVKSHSIVWIRLTVFSDSKARIKIAHRAAGKLHVLRIGIDPKIDLEEVVKLLPAEAKVFDARKKWSSKRKVKA